MRIRKGPPGLVVHSLITVASKQEMKAKSQEARAKVILAEAAVPKAMAEAFRGGNLGSFKFLGSGKK